MCGKVERIYLLPLDKSLRFVRSYRVMINHMNDIIRKLNLIFGIPFLFMYFVLALQGLQLILRLYQPTTDLLHVMTTANKLLFGYYMVANFAGGSTRKYIEIEAGTYRETVYIPRTSVPLYGTRNSADNVHIILEQSAQSSNDQYESGDPAFAMYKNCIRKSKIETTCSSIVWIQADNVQITNMAIENPSKAAQAVAVQTKADKVHFENVNFYGFQVNM
ncbi:hypothetical protein GWI33_004932 [Rhynchophorus ferrugineus]|uniref:Pectinesterase n=1 Tax=Rhynchophorus ferrugineus TaxID=354439 RepID=A0A834MP09_RHYFE|nr:hypothetical protein GWI33_004932 [Rhynchophorus ferrugineus]